MTERDRIRLELLKRYQELGTWKRVAAYYDLNRGTVYMIADPEGIYNGYFPKRPDILKKLGYIRSRDMLAMSQARLLEALENRVEL